MSAEQLGNCAAPSTIRAGSGALLRPLTVAELLLDHFEVVSRDRVMHVVLDLDRSVDAYDRAAARGAQWHLGAGSLGEGVGSVHTGSSFTALSLTAVLPDQQT